MSQNKQGYLARSWALLTRDRGWIKPVLALSAASLVPIVGGLGISGYALEWARLTAWGVDSAPKQRNVRVGECIASGWRAFVAVLGYAVAVAVVGGLLRRLFGGFFGSLLDALLYVALAVVGGVVSLRTAIYQRIGAGYQVRRVWELLRGEPSGLVRIAGMTLLLEVLVGLAVGLASLVIVVPVATQLAASAYGFGLFERGGASSAAVARWIAVALGNSIGSIVLGVVVTSFIAAFGMVLTTLLTHTATGLWLRQFDVPAWGDSDDPLPTGVPRDAGAAGADDGHGLPAAPGAGGAYAAAAPDVGVAAGATYGADGTPVDDAWQAGGPAADAVFGGTYGSAGGQAVGFGVAPGAAGGPAAGVGPQGAGWADGTVGLDAAGATADGVAAGGHAAPPDDGPGVSRAVGADGVADDGGAAGVVGGDDGAAGETMQVAGGAVPRAEESRQEAGAGDAPAHGMGDVAGVGADEGLSPVAAVAAPGVPAFGGDAGAGDAGKAEAGAADDGDVTEPVAAVDGFVPTPLVPAEPVGHVDDAEGGTGTVVGEGTDAGDAVTS